MTFINALYLYHIDCVNFLLCSPWFHSSSITMLGKFVQFFTMLSYCLFYFRLNSKIYSFSGFRCGKCWFDNQFSQDCTECGGFAMTRNCPICLGRCSEMWKRNVKMVRIEIVFQSSTLKINCFLLLAIQSYFHNSLGLSMFKKKIN